MTYGKSRRGTTLYMVMAPDQKTAETICITLGHTRERDVLEALIRAGATGCSFYDAPAPRWASSVHTLRKRGVQITTLRETHGGDYPGTHARYVLVSAVTPSLGGGAI
jgi:transposase